MNLIHKMDRKYKDAVWSLIGMANRMQVRKAYSDAQTSPFIRSLLIALFDIDNIISDDLPEKYISIKEHTLNQLYKLAQVYGEESEVMNVIEYIKNGDHMVPKDEPKEEPSSDISDDKPLTESITGIPDTARFIELLRENSGETYWNPLLGHVTVTPSANGKLIHLHQGDIIVDIGNDLLDSMGNIALYPSRSQKDWKSWYEYKNAISQFPTEGFTYYYLDERFNICHEVAGRFPTDFEKALVEIGNIFSTMDLAEAAKERLVITLKKFKKENLE